MIPGTAHLIWLGPEISWVTALSAASAALRGGFERVLFHHTDPLARSSGSALLERARGVETRLLDAVFVVERAGGSALVDRYRALAEPAARANVLRVALLHAEGGVYLDADTVTIRSLAGERARGGFFCGEEPLAFPGTTLPPWVSRLDPRALAKTALRDLCRRLPRGDQAFRRLAHLYRKAANNAVLGSEPGHPLLGGRRDRMRSLAPRQAARRYALGTHLLQAELAASSRNDVRVLPPEVFYPLGPEISEHWFRRRPDARLEEVISERTLAVHWYASVRVRERAKAIDSGWVRAHAGSELFSALCAPLLSELGE